MTISLTPEVEEFVAEKIRAGQYGSADEAVNALLAMTMDHERLTPQGEEDLRARLDPAIGEADRGEFIDFDAEQIIAEGRAAQVAHRKGA